MFHRNHHHHHRSLHHHGADHPEGRVLVCHRAARNTVSSEFQANFESYNEISIASRHNKIVPVVHRTSESVPNEQESSRVYAVAIVTPVVIAPVSSSVSIAPVIPLPRPAYGRNQLLPHSHSLALPWEVRGAFTDHVYHYVYHRGDYDLGVENRQHHAWIINMRRSEFQWYHPHR